MQNIKDKILSHKKISIVILLVTVVILYYGYKALFPTNTVSTYLLGTTTKGTIVSTITGTGQVSALNQLNVTPKVSGAITSVRVEAGEPVGQGQTLFTIDSRDAAKKVRDAELDLQTTITNADLQSKNSDIQAKNNAVAVENAHNNLLNSTFELVSNDSLTERSTKPTISGNYILKKEGIINIKTYGAGSGIYMSTEGLINDARSVNTLSNVPLGDTGLFINFPATTTSSMSWTLEIPNKNASNYISNKNNYEQALRTQSDYQATDPATLLNIQAKRNALEDAKQSLSDYSVRALFSGVIASVPVKIGDQVSSGTTLSTIITKQQIATIPFNEVDISKVKIGQKVTATFDAIEGLEITGKVISMDLIGTVTSGVVNYNVKVGFDTNDDRIKPGMSTNVSIATNIAQDILMVPTSAIKSTNGNYYVQLAPSGSKTTNGNTGVELTSAPTQAEITKGISDDINTEIKSGLVEGDIIVTKTITSTATTKAVSTAPSILGGTGGTRLGR